MNLTQILTELRQEVQALDDAINALQRLRSLHVNTEGSPQISLPKRRGRPPGSTNKAKSLTMTFGG
jgi:hypothetical protein